MLPTMDEKEITTNNPVVVIQPSQDTKKMSSTKKYVIIGVISIILLGLLLTGILVGMHIFTKAQQDLVEFTLKLNDGRSQDVTSDVTNNVVKYHVKGVEQETWIVSDFNKDIKATKILKDGISNCYLSPLNRSNAVQPSEITKPETDAITNPTGYIPVVYQVAEDPITDNSFLSKDTRDMCKGVSTYWLYPSCGKANTENPMNNNTLSRNKRQANCFRKRYIYSYLCNADLVCVCGCNLEVCARIVYHECYRVGNLWTCNFFHPGCFLKYRC